MSLVFHPLVQRDINVALRYYDDEGGRGLGDRFYAELNVKLGEVLDAQNVSILYRVKFAEPISVGFHIIFYFVFARGMFEC